MSSYFFLVPNRQTMECSICFDSVCSQKIVRLECGHRMCLGCAKAWIVEKGRDDCPMCRKHTAYFSRETRSKKYSLLLAKSYPFIMGELRQEDNGICVENLLLALDIFYFPCINLWRRPDMKALIHPLKSSISDVLQSNNNDVQILPHNLREALHHFINSK